MKSFKSGIFIPSIGVLMAFLSVLYVSCYKAELNPEICQDLICQHQGYCFQDTAKHTHYCICPFGYQGTDCSIKGNAKFFGTWSVTETVLSSNNPSYTGQVNHYSDSIIDTGIPYTFFINNFKGDPSFYKVTCLIDSNRITDPSETVFNFYPLYSPVQQPNFHITGGKGTIVENTITGVYYTSWVDTNFNLGYPPQTDTIGFTMQR